MTRRPGEPSWVGGCRVDDIHTAVAGVSCTDGLAASPKRREAPGGCRGHDDGESEGMTKDLKLELIGRVPLFSGCDAGDIKWIGRLADEVDVAAGHVILREGTTAHEFIIVIDGALRVERLGSVINRLGPGDFAGEIALVDGGPRTATVIADVPSRLFVIGHREFHSLLKKRPSIELQVLQALARRVRASEPHAVF
jgi:CRP/FNR family transcriptional regulator, cyclic AMP receptor protein